MRYRIKDYAVAVNTTIGRLMIYFNAPDYAYDSDLEVSLSDQLKESVRLVVDETAKIVFASSMQKDNILAVDTTAISGYGYRMLFNIPSGATVTTSDFFTLEFDFGEAPEDSAKDATVAKEATLTAARQAVMQAIAEVGARIGDCILHDIECTCLPFNDSGFCAILGDNDYVFDDFAPQVSDVSDFAVGKIIKVTGPNGLQEEYEGYQIGDTLAVACTVNEETLSQNEDGTMNGILTHIEWEQGKYYRLTGIYECWSEKEQDTITVYTYEELDEAGITDLAKQMVNTGDKLLRDYFDLVEAGSETLMTQTEIEDATDEAWDAVFS